MMLSSHPSRRSAPLRGVSLPAILIGFALLASCGPDTLAPDADSPLIIGAIDWPTGVRGEEYGPVALVATGGDGQYVWSADSGELPPGLTVHSATVAGVPASSGDFAFTLEVSSGDGQVRTAEVSIHVDDPAGPDPVARPVAILRGQETFLVTAAGDDEVQLTSSATVQVEWVGWSPNGDELAFIGAPSGELRELWVMNGDGSDQRVISDVVGPVGGRPAWSPDGQRLLFSAWAATYVVNRDGTGQVDLTPASGAVTSATWSPDGQWIAYHGLETDGRTGIFRMRPDGTDRTRILEVEWSMDRIVRYAPTGSLIAYDHLSEIWTMNEDGSDATALTDSPGSGDDSPVWSPDGTHIAFRTDGGSYFDIAVIEIGSGATVAQKGHQGIGDADNVVWSPDGTRIVFRLGADLVVGPIADAAAWTSLTNGTSASWHPGG